MNLCPNLENVSNRDSLAATRRFALHRTFSVGARLEADQLPEAGPCAVAALTSADSELSHRFVVFLHRLAFARGARQSEFSGRSLAKELGSLNAVQSLGHPETGGSAWAGRIAIEVS